MKTDADFEIDVDSDSFETVIQQLFYSLRIDLNCLESAREYLVVDV